MTATEALRPGVDTFTLFDLLRRASAHNGLVFHEGASHAYSEPIIEYALDEARLAFLASRGICRHDRPDCGGDIFTLVDENPQDSIPGFVSSNYWNFRAFTDGRRGFDLRISLAVGFKVDDEKCGIILIPRAHGPFVSAAEMLPNFRMFQALADSDPNAPAVAKEVAASEGTVLVSWDKLGLGGIRKLTDLFSEFVGQNDAVAELGKSRGIFDPPPHPHYQTPGDDLFVAKSAQPIVIGLWRGQLGAYREKLVA